MQIYKENEGVVQEADPEKIKAAEQRINHYENLVRDYQNLITDANNQVTKYQNNNKELKYEVDMLENQIKKLKQFSIKIFRAYKMIKNINGFKIGICFIIIAVIIIVIIQV